MDSRGLLFFLHIFHCGVNNAISALDSIRGVTPFNLGALNLHMIICKRGTQVFRSRPKALLHTTYSKPAYAYCSGMDSLIMSAIALFDMAVFCGTGSFVAKGLNGTPLVPAPPSTSS